jgi:outer membrane protein assembly factor BamB
MKRILLVFFISGILAFIENAVICQINPERQWTAYRGRYSSGVLDNADLPATYSLREMVNIRWKTTIPGLGLSSPVIWGNKLFITTAVSQGDKAGFKPGIYGDITPVNDLSIH